MKTRLRRRLAMPLGVLAILGGTLTEQVRAGDTWALERCVREALAASHSLRAGAHKVERAHAVSGESKAVRWPIIGISGNYTYTSETMEIDLPQFAGFAPRDIRFGDGNVYDLSLVARLPVFTGGTLRSRVLADEAAYRAARRDLAADSLRVVHEVRVAYFATLGAMAQADAAQVAEARLGRHVEDLELAVELGTASVENLVQAQAQLRLAEQQRLALEAQATARRLNLGRLTGRPDEEVTPEGDLGESPPRHLNLESMTVEGRPELLALDERVDQSKRMARSARGAYFPSVSAQLSYHHAKPGVDLVADEWMQYASAGIVLSWPLWDWGARAQRVRQARVSGRALEEQRALLHDALENSLAIARTTLESAREQKVKAEERVQLERRRLDLVSGRYRNAAASESERLDAEDDLAAAEIALAAAAAQVRLAEAELLFASGR